MTNYRVKPVGLFLNCLVMAMLLNVCWVSLQFTSAGGLANSAAGLGLAAWALLFGVAAMPRMPRAFRLEAGGKT